MSQEKRKHIIKMGLSLIPWFHAYGFITTMAVMCMHVEVVFLIRFDEQQFLETIQNYKVFSEFVSIMLFKIGPRVVKLYDN